MTGRRDSVRVFGCVELYSARFRYHRDTVFNAQTYLNILEQIARHDYPRPVFYIQDNASYHKEGQVWEWFKANRSWWEVHHLPPYCPHLNATERLWHHTRLNGTHHRYFAEARELISTLTSTFRGIQHHPEQIRGYLSPFI